MSRNLKRRPRPTQGCRADDDDDDDDDIYIYIYISNKVLHADLKVPTIREEITKFSVKNRDKITIQPKELASTLLEKEEPRRLKIFKPTDLTTRFS